MKTFVDNLQRKVTFNFPPQRIISLVPSITALLFDLGLNDKIVGITKFCTYPEMLTKSKIKVGGTKDIDFNTIEQLNPDLIIANKEENTKDEILKLAERYKVWVSHITNFQEALNLIAEVGKLTDKIVEAEQLILKIKDKFELLPNLGQPSKSLELLEGSPKKVAYFIWKNPYMTINKNTFIHSIIEKCGFKNVFAGSPDGALAQTGKKEHYPGVSAEEIVKANPDIILLSSEPYPFKEKHIAEFKKIVPLSEIKLVDGKMFSWYGSYMLKAPDYLKQLF